MKQNKLFTLPNILALIRVLLIPIFIVFYLNQTFYLDGGYPLYAILVFILACVLDVVDGMVARKYNSTTLLGKVLDPAADKLFRNGVLIAFTIKNVMPLYIVIILGVIDLVSIGLGIFLLTKKIVIKANMLGKITTIVMSVSLFSCFLSDVIYPWNLVLVLISVTMALISLIVYIVYFYKMYNLTVVK